jgi:transformation/transcription domain-associated protein
MQTLTLLGKLGGRNRRWLKAPQELPYKEHTEHGMRLILTLLPSTSFLVPLDKCLQFSLDAIAGKGKGTSVSCVGVRIPPVALAACMRGSADPKYYLPYIPEEAKFVAVCGH